MQKYIFSLFIILITINSVFSQEKPRVALIPLNPMGVSDTEAEVASNLLETALVNTDKFIILEQNQVNTIIQAQSFSLAGNTDETYAKEIGKLLPVEQLLMGTFSHVGSEFILTAKIIDIESGQNIKAEKVTFFNINELSNSVESLANRLTENEFSTQEIVLDTRKSEDSNWEPDSSSKYFYQLSLGSSYSFYFHDIQIVLDSMDQSTLRRIPFSIDFLFGKKISPTTAWTGTLNSGMDIFLDSSNSFQMYTILLSVGVQYIPFQKGLTLGLGAGFSILIPNTTLNYIGNIGFGSTISFDMGYYFEALKFSKAGIVPGLGIKYIHSEILRGTVDQINGYITLGIR